MARSQCGLNCSDRSSNPCDIASFSVSASSGVDVAEQRWIYCVGRRKNGSYVDLLVARPSKEDPVEARHMDLAKKDLIRSVRRLAYTERSGKAGVLFHRLALSRCFRFV